MPRVKIEKSENISPTTKLFTLTALDDDLHFLPGQYFSFFVPRSSGEQAVRAYSFCTTPNQLPHFQICVKQVPGGVGTSYINQNVGQEVEISEAQGEFVLPPSTDYEVTFLASGTGVAPVMSMLSVWLEQNKQSKTILIYRLNQMGEFLFQTRLEKCVKDNPGFQLVVLSGIDYNKVRDGALNKLSRSGKQNQIFYVVGPPRFVKENTDQLEKFGYDGDKIVTDIWT